MVDGSHIPKLCSVDGRIGPVAEATVSITDDGFLRGDGAFEMLKIYGGRPFALTDHLDRLDRSASGIFLDYDRSAFEREIEALLDASGHSDWALRLVLSRGGRRIAIIEDLPAFEHGLKLSSVRYQSTIVLTQLKTLSYGGNMRATRLAQRDGADEALLVEPDGSVLEAPTSTLFWVDADGGLHTPELETGVLASITRERTRARYSLPRRCGRCRASPHWTASGSSAPARSRAVSRICLPSTSRPTSRAPCSSRVDESGPDRRAAPDPRNRG
jgi:branched-chain amino acid aminotransferase